ncbi:MAG: aldo/keto reductase [Candidatus Kariarchaeaceae archaeon]|jgi:aryl-alcohol dehydrogenase-like predicted oxidoreductase
MITKLQFGRTEHKSTRIIFGSYALNNSTREEADQVLPLLRKFGVNHIDTAPMYGNAESLIGNWLTKHRDEFFIATKTRNRGRQAALDTLHKSLEHLQIDYIDLWQMHGLTNPQGWEKVMGPKGTLEAFIEARDAGLVRYLGVTGHGSKTPIMHKRSLERFDFDSVMLPYNFQMMQNPRYVSNFDELVKMCQDRNVAIQTIKSIARRPWENRSRKYNTYFYEPLDTNKAINKSVWWTMSLQNSFIATAGDLQILPMILDAAAKFEKQPSDEEMNQIMKKYDIRSIFTY